MDTDLSEDEHFEPHIGTPVLGSNTGNMSHLAEWGGSLRLTETMDSLVLHLEECIFSLAPNSGKRKPD